MSLNNTYFETRGRDVSVPVPDTPGYTPPTPPTPPTPGSGSEPVIPRPGFSGNVSIQFYICNSDDDVLDKNISAYGSAKDVTVKEEINLLDFIIPFNDASLVNVNYAYMMGRYYYCEPIINAGNLTGIHFKVDALMSWKDNIKGIYAIVDRTGSQYNTYLNDPEIKITSYNNIHRLEASGSLSQQLHYYLLAIGL